MVVTKAESNRRYYLKNKEQHTQHNKKYYSEHKEGRKSYNKTYYEQSKEIRALKHQNKKTYEFLSAIYDGFMFNSLEV